MRVECVLLRGFAPGCRDLVVVNHEIAVGDFFLGGEGCCGRESRIV
jgi:hypothetical protein